MNDFKHLQQWIGRTQETSCTIDLATCQRMEATLDQEAALTDGDVLPSLWHWLFFHQPAKMNELGRDGHAKKGQFLPPVTLPRRMWAGGRFEFFNDLPIGCKATRKSTIKSVEMKRGRSGELCFVTVRHEITINGNICLTEEHDLVYREDAKPDDSVSQAPTADDHPDFMRTITPSPELLFRYSALTFNSHKIHYDRDYCRNIENYPGLVFHGPLTATLLVQLAMNNFSGGKLSTFEFRAVSPLFDTSAFEVRGWLHDNQISLQAVNAEDQLAMTASAIIN